MLVRSWQNVVLLMLFVTSAINIIPNLVTSYWGMAAMAGHEGGNQAIRIGIGAVSLVMMGLHVSSPFLFINAPKTLLVSKVVQVAGTILLALVLVQETWVPVPLAATIVTFVAFPALVTVFYFYIAGDLVSSGSEGKESVDA